MLTLTSDRFGHYTLSAEDGRSLKADSRAVVIAAAQAQKAADFIRGVRWEDKPE